jgi:hypothetical protein
MATSLFQSKAPVGSPAWLHSTVASAQDHIRSERGVLTPDLANELLKSNDGNRGVSAVAVAQFSADITADRWAMNGEPIIVAKNGLLVDGQHRCHAVIDANKSIETIFVVGVEPQCRLTVDVGRKRTASDILHIEGVPNAAIAGAIARLAISFESSAGQHLHNAKYVTSAEIRERISADAKIAHSAVIGARYATVARRYVSGSTIGFCHYVLSRINPVAAQEYIEKVVLGEGLKRNDAAYSVRERLLSEGKQRDKKVALILRGWTFYRRNRSVAVTSLPAKLPFPALF